MAYVLLKEEVVKEDGDSRFADTDWDARGEQAGGTERGRE
jgi:hypothetical protein